MINNIYINIGNTNITFANSTTENINDLKFIKKETKKFDSENCYDLIDEIFDQFENKITFAFISCVSESVGKKFKEYLEERGIHHMFISCKNIPYIDLSNLYNSYELGADILAQSNYIGNFFDEAIVVSCGTSFVIYHMKKLKFSGCIIFPGIEKMIETIKSTTDINSFDIVQTNNVFGFNTNEAISIGIKNSIEIHVENIIKKLNLKCPVICTGGSMNYFRNNDWWFIDNLEILGLFVFVQNKIKGY